MTAKNKRKFSLLPWLLLLIVGGGWFLDAATRPQPEPFLTRLGSWMVEQGTISAEGDDALVSVGKWVIGLSQISLDRAPAAPTPTPVPIPGGTPLPAPLPAPEPPLQGRWKLITAKSMDGVSVRQSPNSLCHLEFRENGTIELITTTPDGRYFTDTLYWDEDNGQLRVDDKFLFLGGADHCDYIVQGSTLTIRYQVTSGTIVHNRVAVFRRAD